MSYTEVIDIRRGTALEITDMPGRKGQKGDNGTPASAFNLSELSDTTFTNLLDGDSLFRSGSSWLNLPAYTASQVDDLVATRAPLASVTALEDALDALAADYAATPLWVGGPALSSLDSAAEVRSALDVPATAAMANLVPSSGSRTANRLTRYDASGNLVPSGLSDNGNTVLSSARGLIFSAEANPGAGTGISRPVNGMLRLQTSGFFEPITFYVDDYVGNWDGFGLSVGKGATSAARRFESVDSTALQIRTSHTPSTKFADWGANADGRAEVRPSGTGLDLYGGAAPSLRLIDNTDGRYALVSYNAEIGMCLLDDGPQQAINIRTGSVGNPTLWLTQDLNYRARLQYLNSDSSLTLANLAGGPLRLKAGHASGTNTVGGDLLLDVGPSTGSGASAVGRLRAWAAEASGSTLQSTAIDVLTWNSVGLSLFGNTPVAQGAPIADPTDATSTTAAVVALLTYLRSRGDIAT